MSRRCSVTTVVGAALLWAAAPAAQVFRSRVDSVLVDVSVRQDRREVVDLTAADFEVRDNGVPQAVHLVSVGQAIPISFVALVDVSASVERAGTSVVDPRPILPRMREFVAGFDSLLLPDDHRQVMTFDSRLREVAAAGSVQRLPLTESRYTALWDAVARSLMLRAEPGRRRFVVVLTDGLDTHSMLDYRTLVAVAARTDVVLHLFVLSQPALSGRIAPAPVRFVSAFSEYSWFLQKAAALTGGRYYELQIDQDVVEHVRQALGELRRRYLLRYTPGEVKPGGWHTIEVKLKRPGRFEVNARKGYLWR